MKLNVEDLRKDESYCVRKMKQTANGVADSGDVEQLKKLIEQLRLASEAQGKRIVALENAVKIDGQSVGAKVAAAPAEKGNDDDDVDLFGSDDDDDDEENDPEKAALVKERLAAYHAKKSKKPAVVAKTSVLIDVKPWDDETDMDATLAAVKTITMDGLLWGASKLVPIGYGIKKLQVMCVVEDDKVSIEELCEKIAEFEDLVQSADVASMSKI